MPVAEAVNHPPADLMALLKSTRSHFMSQLISNMENKNLHNSDTGKSIDPTQAITIKTEDLIKSESAEQKSPEEAVSSTSASSPMDSVDDERVSPTMSLPRESEHAERKRPAAIQELLQMKKARLRLNDKVQKSPKKSMTIKEEISSTENSSVSSTPIPSTSGGLSDIFEKICHAAEEDNETTASSGSSHNGIDHANTTANLLASFGVNNIGDSAALMRALQQSVGAALKQQQVAIAAAMSAQAANTQATGPTTPNRLSMASDNGVYEAPNNGTVSHDQVFAQVPGRLSLLSNVVKYKMTVGEVRRRLMGPEAFNFSLLGALLRRAKMPEKSQMLVEELAKVGLSIARGRRRLSQITLLSALTESESVQLAKDFHKIAEQEFPAKKLAEYATHQFTERTSPEMLSLVNGTGMLTEKLNKARLIEERMQQLQHTKELMAEFIELLGQDRSSVMDSNPDPVLDPNVQDPLTQFSMLTHGFGTPAILAGMHMFANFIGNQIELVQEQQKQINKKR